MSKSRKRHARHRSNSIVYRWRTLRLAGIMCFLCLGIIAVTAAFIQNSAITFGQSTTRSTPNGNCSKLTTTVTTGSQAGTVWAKVLTNSAADVLAAVKCLPMFQSASQGNDLIARAMQHGRLANPLLIKPYRQDAGLPQIWLVPVVGQNNRPTALLTFTYDDKAHELSADDFAAVTGNMFYMTHIFPSIRAGEAIAAVKREHHVAIATNRSAELIYFPSDVNSLQDGKQSWRLGGTSVLDPIWRVPGANGHWYYIDHSGHSHQSNELPVEASMPAAPDSTAIQ